MPESGVRHIVLVHGAWQGSWSFAAWRPLLQARGWQVHAVDLPGNGWPPLADAPASLDAYTAHVVAVVRAIGQPVALLGHSGGGQTVAQVAEAVPDQIAVLVYLAGMMLPSGQTYADFVRQAAVDDPALASAGIGAHLDWLDGGRVSQVQPDGARRLFLHDVEPGAAQAAIDLLRPQPETGRQMRNRLSAERFGRVPRVYLGCRDDRSLLWPLQQRMQRLTPGALALDLDCGHVPQLAQPAALTHLLLPALERFLH